MEDKLDSGIVVFGYLHNDRRETASLVSQFGQMELDTLKDNIHHRVESSNYCEPHVHSLQKYLRAEYSSIHHEDSIFEGDPLQHSNELVCEILFVSQRREEREVEFIFHPAYSAQERDTAHDSILYG